MSDAPGSRTGAGGLFARIANSAEYSIAAALLAVCVVVGGSLWLLQPDETDVATTPMVAPAVRADSVDEDAALDDWKQRLGEQFDELEVQQRQRAAEEEETRRARQRAEEAAAEARRQAEAAAQVQRRLEAAVPAPTVTPRSTPAVRTPPPRQSTPPPQAPPTVAPAPALVPAAIDWSSCDRPGYPALSVRRGEEGTVVISAELDAQARLIDARVSESSGHAKLDRATLDAVRECRFTPALENGTPKASTAEVRFTWRLN